MSSNQCPQSIHAHKTLSNMRRSLDFIKTLYFLLTVPKNITSPMHMLKISSVSPILCIAVIMLDKRREANSVLIKREQFCSGISASLSKAILPLPLPSFPSFPFYLPPLLSLLCNHSEFLSISHILRAASERLWRRGIHYVGRRFSGRDIARS